MSRWEYGRDLHLIEHKAQQAQISFAKGSEMGTSSHCPACGHKQRPAGRIFTCSSCGKNYHRDVMGSLNMHPLGFGQSVPVVTTTKYLRPNHKPTEHKQPIGGSSSRPVAGHSGAQAPTVLSQVRESASNPDANTAIDVEYGLKHSPQSARMSPAALPSVNARSLRSSSRSRD